ncbi:MAG TPA: WecB/TagA/CpsF family glycosyltransferase [Actinomycetota bacterium]|nr:WecB/TagA/CpsF family glycosyltransferase [Actinomycetota bacterium]
MTGCSCAQDRKPRLVLGVPVDPLTTQEALQRLDRFLNCPATHVVHHLAADPIVRSTTDSGFADALNRSDANLPDGAGVVWALRALGVSSIRDRVYGPDMMRKVLAGAAGAGAKHAFVGATAEVVEALASMVPPEQRGGSYAPPHRQVTPEAVQEDLLRLSAASDILWVGLGTPKQQQWADLAVRFRPARVIVTVGAAFDFLTGSKPQAPAWMAEHGLEWLFRLATEPRRLWRRYLIGIPRFIFGVLAQALRERRSEAVHHG